MTESELTDAKKKFLEEFPQTTDWIAKLIIDQFMELQKQKKELDEKFEKALKLGNEGNEIAAYYELEEIREKRLEMGDHEGSEITTGYVGLYLAIHTRDLDTAKKSLKHFEKQNHQTGIRRIKELIVELDENENKE